MSSIFIKIIITHTLDLVTGSSLKRWLQLDSLLQSKVVQATNETHVKQKLLVVFISVSYVFVQTCWSKVTTA